MVVHLPWLWVVVLDAVAWAAWSVLASWSTSWSARRRLAAGGLDRDGPVLTLRDFERGGAWYERALRVKAWKHLLPEAGRAFGGRSKRHLPPGRAAALPRFLDECRHAERTHWLILTGTPLFAIWNPPRLFAAMVAFALVANVPCLVVLRYNRARLLASRANVAP